MSVDCIWSTGDWWPNEDDVVTQFSRSAHSAPSDTDVQYRSDIILSSYTVCNWHKRYAALCSVDRTLVTSVLTSMEPAALRVWSLCFTLSVVMNGYLIQPSESGWFSVIRWNLPRPDCMWHCVSDFRESQYPILQSVRCHCAVKSRYQPRNSVDELWRLSIDVTGCRRHQ